MRIREAATEELQTEMDSMNAYVNSDDWRGFDYDQARRYEALVLELESRKRSQAIFDLAYPDDLRHGLQ